MNKFTPLHKKALPYFAAIALSATPATAAPNIDHWLAEQNAPVYFVQATALPMVDIRIVFAAGSARDGEQYGVASLTSAMQGAAAASWDTDQIAARFDDVGAQFSAGAGQDRAWLSLRSLTEPARLQQSLQTLAAILSKPSFNQNDFAREQRQTLAAIKLAEESPAAIASKAFAKTLYGKHPYAHPNLGNTATVSALTAKAVRNFYQRYYVQRNAMVVIVGDVTKSQASAIAEQLLQGLPLGNKPADLPKVQTTPGGSHQHIEFPSSQTHIITGLVGKHRKDPDYFSLYVGNHILGGSGLVSLLGLQVREAEGLAYSIYSAETPMQRRGKFYINLQTRNQQASRARKTVRQTLATFIQKGASAEQLLAAKKNIGGGFALRTDTNSKLLRYVAMIGFYRLPLDYLQQFTQKVQSVTTESIQDAFARRIKLDQLHTITVGKAVAGDE